MMEGHFYGGSCQSITMLNFRNTRLVSLYHTNTSKNRVSRQCPLTDRGPQVSNLSGVFHIDLPVSQQTSQSLVPTGISGLSVIQGPRCISDGKILSDRALT
ncbi:uncharacterized protein LOC143373959 isoform X3 [Andrena cerasifolii]|uniref:uncharacterized protein LOC143373959 isoform X3 n=1 Tax=Andrena cerasifolii TaxID=2819439 RepID=UPI00403818BB